MQHKKLLGSLTVLALALYGCQAPLAGLAPTGQGAVPTASQTAGAISGVVRDAQGQLLAGAVVRVLPANAGPRQTPILGATDASGRFSVKVPGKGPYNVIVQSERLNQAAVKFRLMNGVTEDFDLTPTSSISGTVSLREGDAAIGALVYIPGTSLMAVTQTDGTYTITGVPVFAPGYPLAVNYQGYPTKNFNADYFNDSYPSPSVQTPSENVNLLLDGLIRPVAVFSLQGSDTSVDPATGYIGPEFGQWAIAGDVDGYATGTLETGCSEPAYRLLTPVGCSPLSVIQVKATGTYLVRYTINAPPLTVDVENLRNQVVSHVNDLELHHNPTYRLLVAGTPYVELVSFDDVATQTADAVPVASTTFGWYGTTSGKAVMTLGAGHKLGLRLDRAGQSQLFPSGNGTAVSIAIERIGEDGPIVGEN